MPGLAVPQAANGSEIATEEILEFRDQRLSAQRLWQTGFGTRLLVWFWRTWLGRWLARRFRDATPDEIRGYQFWAPVAVVITTAELLGLGKIASFDYWPTISTTVGDLQDRDSRWGLVVVALIALAAFYAVAYKLRPPVAPEFVLRGNAGQAGAIRYSWRIVYAVTIGAAVAAALLLDEKIHRGYLIYATLALFGIIIPFALALPWRGEHRVAFPNLFFTFTAFRERFRPAASIVVALLAILVLHLALYPWPDLARESASFGGLTGHQARGRALAALDEPGIKEELRFSTSQRSVVNGRDAWHVYYNDLVGGEPVYNGCYVVVVRDRRPEPSEGCSG
jgi:hypothetical protein